MLIRFRPHGEHWTVKVMTVETGPVSDPDCPTCLNNEIR